MSTITSIHLRERAHGKRKVAQLKRLQFLSLDSQSINNLIQYLHLMFLAPNQDSHDVQLCPVFVKEKVYSLVLLSNSRRVVLQMHRRDEFAIRDDCNALVPKECTFATKWGMFNHHLTVIFNAWRENNTKLAW